MTCSNTGTVLTEMEKLSTTNMHENEYQLLLIIKMYHTVQKMKYRDRGTQRSKPSEKRKEREKFTRSLIDFPIFQPSTI